MTAGYLAVFVGWRIPALSGVMSRFFVDNPTAPGVFQMVGSAFSHRAPLHLAANSYVLWMFGGPLIDQIGVPQFAGFALAAGMSSAMLAQLHGAASRLPPLGGLGASGMIFGLVALDTVLNPDRHLQIIFLPFLSGPAPYFLAGMMLLDLTGLVLGWRVLGHAAHLGGATFGLAWGMWGQDGYKRLRRAFATFSPQTPP